MLLHTRHAAVLISHKIYDWTFISSEQNSDHDRLCEEIVIPTFISSEQNSYHDTLCEESYPQTSELSLALNKIHITVDYVKR